MATQTAAPISSVLSDEEADRLDGTLPGILPNWANALITPARALAWTLGLLALLLVLAVRFEFFAAVAQLGAFCVGGLLDGLGLISAGPDASSWDHAGDVWGERVQDRVGGPDYAWTGPIALAALACAAFGYGAGRVDRDRRRPGRRVRYSAERHYLMRTKTVTGVGTGVGPNGQVTTTTTVSTVQVPDPEWTVVSIFAWRERDGGPWTVEEETINSFEDEAVDACYAKMQARAAELDEAERRRLADVYRGR